MRNKEFWLVKEELDKIEARQAERRKELEALRAEIAERKENFKSDTACMLTKSTRIQTALIAGVMSFIVIILNIYVRLSMGMTANFGNIALATLTVVPVVLMNIAIAYFTVRHTKKKAEKLCDAIEEVSKGNLNIHLETENAGSYKKTYESFNEMCEKLSIIGEDLKRAVELANDANDAKSRFLSSVSHEIRTPINAVLGLDEMIIRESGEDKIKGYAQDIKNAGKSLLSIVNDILDSSKIESGKMEIVPATYDFTTLVDELANMTELKADKKDLEFRLEADPELPCRLFGDEIRLKQCILNLLTNAVKYTTKGYVELKFWYDRLDGEDIMFNVSVADTGIGIKEEDIERLFTPFERIEEARNHSIEGTGLGMSITKQLLALMGSELKVSSVYGQGTTFTFSVKQKVMDWNKVGDIHKSLERLKENTGAYIETFHAPDARILVVDDASINLVIVEGLLKQTQIKIDSVESGMKAIELSKENEYDLIIVDYMMPEMDGVETMRRLRNDTSSKNRRVPIVVLTANAVTGAKEGYLKEGFTDYLPKPVEPQKLEQCVKNYLPKEKITEVKISAEEAAAAQPAETAKDAFMSGLINIPEIDTTLGLEYSGTADLYKNVVTEFAETGISRADTIEQLFEQQDIRNYTIQVHALKSAARLVGAMDLSNHAKKLEACGNENDTATIEAETGELLSQYRALVDAILPLLDSGEELPPIEDDMLKEALGALREMVDGFDFDSADSIMSQLKQYKMPEYFAKSYSKLKTLMAEVARDDIIELIDSLNK